MSTLRVVPASSEPGCPSPTQGTKVFTEDGEEVRGITRIELLAEPGGIWRARLDCMVQLDGEIQVEVLESPPSTPRPLGYGYQPMPMKPSGPPGDE